MFARNIDSVARVSGPSLVAGSHLPLEASNSTAFTHSKERTRRLLGAGEKLRWRKRSGRAVEQERERERVTNGFPFNRPSIPESITQFDPFQTAFQDQSRPK